ncbi:MAG: hypothetical protein ACREUU_06440, partial [Gammaproteobacteria bacterium]
MKVQSRRLLVVLLALPSFSGAWRHALAQGGPPLLTDDPETPGSRRWEINIAYTLEQARREREFQSPLLDLNYGLGDRIQLKFELPWAIVSRDDNPRRNGLGNSLAGVKWRFLDAERRGIAMSLYPQLTFNNPTSSVDRGVVERGSRFKVPVEMSRSFGRFAVNGEFGYEGVQHQNDERLYGIALGYEVSRRLELLSEIHGIELRGPGEGEVLINVGGRCRL